MAAILGDFVEQRIHRVGHHVGAVFAQPFGGQNFGLQRMLGLQPVDNAAGNKRARTVALQQRNELGNERVQQLLMAIVAG